MVFCFEEKNHRKKLLIKGFKKKENSSFLEMNFFFLKFSFIPFCLLVY